MLRRFSRAAGCGFSGVEIQDLSEETPEAIALAAVDAGIEVVLVNVDVGDAVLGGAGLSGVPGKEEAFQGAFARALDAARTLQASFIHLGPSRVPAGVSRAACLDAYHENLDRCLCRLGDAKIRLLVEPMSRAVLPDILIGDVAEAANIVRSFGTNVGLLFDVFHVAMNQESPLAAFEACKDVVRHVQFSDAPGRHEPGTGSVDFPGIFGAIAASGYSGWLGAEYVPTGRTEDSLAWLRCVRAWTSAEAIS